MVRWPVAAVVGVVSLITMPITAMWFLALGPLSLVGGAIAAASTRSQRRATDILATTAGVGIGLLAGPALYLTLAVVT